MAARTPLKLSVGGFHLYRGRRQGRQSWRWKAVHRNGRKLGSGGEAYVHASDAVTGALQAARIIAEAHGYQLVKKG